MTVDPKQLKEIIQMFSELDDSRQKKLISYSYSLLYEQYAEKELKEEADSSKTKKCNLRKRISGKVKKTNK